MCCFNRNRCGCNSILTNDFTCGTWNNGCGIWNNGCGTWNNGCGTWNNGCGTWNNGCGTWNNCRSTGCGCNNWSIPGCGSNFVINPFTSMAFQNCNRSFGSCRC